MHEPPDTIASPPPRRRLAVVAVGVIVALAAIGAVARGLDHSHKPSSGTVTLTHHLPAYTPDQGGPPVPTGPNPATGATPPPTVAPPTAAPTPPTAAP